MKLNIRACVWFLKASWMYTYVYWIVCNSLRHLEIRKILMKKLPQSSFSVVIWRQRLLCNLAFRKIMYYWSVQETGFSNKRSTEFSLYVMTVKTSLWCSIIWRAFVINWFCLIIWNVLSLWPFVRWGCETPAIVDTSFYKIIKNRPRFHFEKYEYICFFSSWVQWKLFPSVTLVNNK